LFAVSISYLNSGDKYKKNWSEIGICSTLLTWSPAATAHNTNIAHAGKYS
jgi:hypothetical protein